MASIEAVNIFRGKYGVFETFDKTLTNIVNKRDLQLLKQFLDKCFDHLKYGTYQHHFLNSRALFLILSDIILFKFFLKEATSIFYYWIGHCCPVYDIRNHIVSHSTILDLLVLHRKRAHLDLLFALSKGRLCPWDFASGRSLTSGDKWFFQGHLYNTMTNNRNLLKICRRVGPFLLEYHKYDLDIYRELATTYIHRGRYDDLLYIISKVDNVEKDMFLYSLIPAALKSNNSCIRKIIIRPRIFLN
jgi:hypothetical protein